MSACVAQLEGGFAHGVSRRPSDTIGRSGLLTTSLPGCTPCPNPTEALRTVAGPVLCFTVCLCSHHAY